MMKLYYSTLKQLKHHLELTQRLVGGGKILRIKINPENLLMHDEANVEGGCGVNPPPQDVDNGKNKELKKTVLYKIRKRVVEQRWQWTMNSLVCVEQIWQSTVEKTREMIWEKMKMMMATMTIITGMSIVEMIA
ncbi:hypothetical protein YC2023_082797 [Brassica napus]